MEKLIRLRELAGRYSRWHRLEPYINRIELAYRSDLDGAISNAHLLIECILKTILCERVEEYRNDPSKLKNLKINPLTTQTLRNINLVRSEENSRFISGMVTSIQNLGEIRNSLSHGKNLPSHKDETTEKITAYFLINSVETIACFLIEFYELEFPLKGKEKMDEYEDYEDFNNWLDDEHGIVMIAGIPIPTSSALWGGDPTAYKEKHQQYLLTKNYETD